MNDFQAKTKRHRDAAYAHYAVIDRQLKHISRRHKDLRELVQAYDTVLRMPELPGKESEIAS